MQQHLDTLSDIELSFDDSLNRAKKAKKYFEDKVEKLCQFQDATRKVDGLDHDDFKGVDALILTIRSEIQTLCKMVELFNVTRKKMIMKYFKVRISEIELCPELNGIAEKYGFDPIEILLNQEARISEHVKDLLFKARFYNNNHKEVKAAQQELTKRARRLLTYKRHFIMIQSPTMDYDIEQCDELLCGITENNQILLDAKDRFNGLVKTTMIDYAKRFISPCDMVPKILDILKRHGITPSTIENTPIVRQLKRSATEQYASVVNQSLIEPKKPRNHQEVLSAIDEPMPVVEDPTVLKPEKQVKEETVDEPMPVVEDPTVFKPEKQVKEETVDEPMPVVHVDQSVLLPQKQEDVSFSVEDCAINLGPEPEGQVQEQVDVEPMPVVEDPTVLKREKQVKEETVDEPMPVVHVDQSVLLPQKQEDVSFSVEDCAINLGPEPEGQVQEQVDIEPMQVVIDQPVPVPGKQKNVPSSVETCATMLGKMLIASDRELQNKMYQQKLDPRISKIKHKLEMIDYVRNNLAPEQLTNQILDMLENKSPGPINLRNRETTLFDRRMSHLETLIKAEKQLNKVRSEIEACIHEATYLMDRELTIYCDSRKAEKYEEIKSQKENELKMILKDIEEKRKVYAAKYIAPTRQIKFIKDPEFPTVLAKMFANAKNKKRLENVRNLGDRLKQLSEDLSNEYDQIKSSSQSTSTSVNVSDCFKTPVLPKNKKVVVQVAEAKNANADANDEQTDNNA